MNPIDLNNHAPPATPVQCGVCIVGAGAAGLYLANRLTRAGVSTVVLEAGGDKCLDGPSIGIDALLGDARYGGTTEGRAFGLGGTTARWGGQLIPHAEADLRPTDQPFDAWQHIVSVVRQRSQAVHDTLGLGRADSYFQLPQTLFADPLAELREADLTAIATEWLPFRRRNLRCLIEGSSAGRQHLQVYLHAVACSWRTERDAAGNARVASVLARSPKGNRVEVAARAFVVAAGAIESARILLEMDHQADRDLLPANAAVGAYLSDHLSCRIAQVAAEDARAVARHFGPRFRDNTMRSFKFVDTAPQPDDPRWCCHFVFDIENPGFQLARKLLAGMQARRAPSVTPGEAIRGTLGLMQLAEHRLLRRRLFVPPRSTVYLQLNIEQAADASNRVTLADERDDYGRPKAIVHWRVTDADHQNIRNITQRFRSAWPADLARLTDVNLAVEDEVMTKPHDVYHPVGTCRLGQDAAAVVDPDLTVNGAANLSVLSTAVFPTAGTANPTFSMLCFADRLAERLVNEGRTKADTMEKAPLAAG